MKGPCILPFCVCPYRKGQECDDLSTSPGNSDAGCFAIKKKKSMIVKARDNRDKTLHAPLMVTTYRKVTANGKFLSVFLSDKPLCVLVWKGPVDFEGVSKWFLEGENFQAVGNNEMDAVEKALEIFGYKNER